MAEEEQQLIGNILVDTINVRFEKQRFNVEFGFLSNTTVETVLVDLEEALTGMDLQMIIPRTQCALAYDNSRSNSMIPIEQLETVDGVGKSATILSGTDCILQAPEVEAFYDLNHRCGLQRTATFLVVRKPPPQRQPNQPTVPQPAPAHPLVSEPMALHALLLPRTSPFAAMPPVSSSALGKSGAAALSRVRGMVSAESRAVCAARPERRALHWSRQLRQLPSRDAWLRALADETAACGALRVRLAERTAALLAQQSAAVDALHAAVAALHERVEGGKRHVARRDALRQRVAALQAELEAQREKESELLRAWRRPAAPGSSETTRNASAIGGGMSGSHFMSPSLRDEVRRALSPSQTSELRRLRALAAELSQHLRSNSPSAAERRRLMAEIRHVRREVERQRGDGTALHWHSEELHGGTNPAVGKSSSWEQQSHPVP